MKPDTASLRALIKLCRENDVVSVELYDTGAPRRIEFNGPVYEAVDVQVDPDTQGDEMYNVALKRMLGGKEKPS